MLDKIIPFISFWLFPLCEPWGCRPSAGSSLTSPGGTPPQSSSERHSKSQQVLFQTQIWNRRQQYREECWWREIHKNFSHFKEVILNITHPTTAFTSSLARRAAVMKLHNLSQWELTCSVPWGEQEPPASIEEVWDTVVPVLYHRIQEERLREMRRVYQWEREQKIKWRNSTIRWF